MKITAQEILEMNEYHFNNLEGVEGLKEWVIGAMKEYAKEALQEAIDKCIICCNNFEATIGKKELENIKNQLK